MGIYHVEFAFVCLVSFRTCFIWRASLS